MQIGATSTTGSLTGTLSGNGPDNSPDRASLQKAAQQFEAIFLRQMMGAMRSASLADGITDSSATEQFQDMADARTADSMATRGTLGIAEMLMHQFGGKTGATAAPAEGKSE